MHFEPVADLIATIIRHNNWLRRGHDTRKARDPKREVLEKRARNVTVSCLVCLRFNKKTNKRGDTSVTKTFC